MVTIVSNLTLADFERRYNHDSDVAYEFWYGKAIPKATPAWLHGLVQLILGQLLSQAGFIPGAEVELRIVSQARPRPDIIAARNPLPADESYPTTAVDLVIEIVPKDDSYDFLKQKCRKYAEWGFPAVYVVDPGDKTIGIWREGYLQPTDNLAGISATEIWLELARRLFGQGPATK